MREVYSKFHIRVLNSKALPKKDNKIIIVNNLTLIWLFKGQGKNKYIKRNIPSTLPMHCILDIHVHNFWKSCKFSYKTFLDVHVRNKKKNMHFKLKHTIYILYSYFLLFSVRKQFKVLTMMKVIITMRFPVYLSKTKTSKILPYTSQKNFKLSIICSLLRLDSFNLYTLHTCGQYLHACGQLSSYFLRY